MYPWFRQIDALLNSLGDLEGPLSGCEALNKRMRAEAPHLESLAKIVTELDCLKELHNKTEMSTKEDAICLEALVTSIGENEKILKDNVAALRARVQALKK